MRPLIYAIDDSTDYRFQLERVYQHSLPNYELRLFDSGSLFIEHIKTAETPGLILLDSQLSGACSRQIIRHIRSHLAWKYLPIIVMTGVPADVLAWYEAGANSCLIKSANAETMRQAMQTLCAYWFSLNKQVMD